MYYVINVINYISGQTYDEKTILEDIDKTFDALYSSTSVKSIFYSQPFRVVNPGKPNALLEDFCSKLGIYLQLLQNKVITFANCLAIDGYPWEYQDIMCYYNMPFRYSRNPMADKKIFQRLYRIEQIGIDQVIMYLLTGYQEEKFNRNQSFLNKLNYFFNGQGISFDSIGKSQHMGWLGYMPLSQQQIINDYLETKDNKDDPLHNKKIGNYGELMYYRYLQQHIPNTQQLMWVSNNLGDGFGYDIAVYDSIANKIYLYEVKATDNPKNFSSCSLEEYEARIRDIIEPHTDSEYHVIRIGLGDTIQMVDIDSKTSTVKDIMNPSRVRVLNKNYNTYNII